jgi:hypothetical protein
MGGPPMRETSMIIMMIVIITCLMLTVLPVSAVKTAEQSVGDSLTRGGRFTVTITGLPNSSYYIWVPHTSSMTGEPRDQPPVIANYQTNVREDPAGGPWPIGSYRYNNGGGQTIRDDIAPTTPGMPNTQYYALVTTDNSGQATVEFLTSVNTGLRSYSVKVESPRSIDSDNLLVHLQVYSRRAPAVTGIFPTPGPVLITAIPPTTLRPLAVTSIPATTTPEPVQTTPPTQVPTQKAPHGVGTGLLAAGVSLLLMRRQ